MEFSMEMGLDEEIPLGEELSGEGLGKISEFSLVPKEGVYLGLDISEASSGVTIYENGNKEVYNISLDEDKNSVFSEVLLRRELAGYLCEVVEGKELDLIVLEDAYQGYNPKTTRLLYALNTAIIEVVLDGKCTCKKFLRVANGTWKSWLYTIDTENRFKGLKDKVRIQKCLELLGVHEEGKGFQDRLDSTGMLLGYFLEGYKHDDEKKAKGISLSDLCFSHKADIDFISEDVRAERCVDEVHIELVDMGQRKLSKDLFLSFIQDDPKPVYVFNKEIVLGAFGVKLGIDTNVDSGYLGFWLKKSKYKKVGD